MAREQLTVSDRDIDAAARVLAGGGIVAYPTETVYGLAVDARRAQAVAALVRLKGRDDGRGISLLVRDLDMAMPLLDAAPPADAYALVDAFWPGPLTIVLPASASVAPALRGPSGGVGLRCSSDPWAARLVETFGAPLTSTSANRSGEPPARSADEVRRAFDGASGLALVVDGGPRDSTSASTVVEFYEGRATVVRAGAVRTESIASIITLEPA
ncbi:MAG TPA: L-threonylcarbamoyladenylate synthase [Candidatus Limnocylindrales bacterium]|nr:L-threonylcarbamoyladenylate synthase [Candidatus Limnocylindrales bacterium]